jgi:hypothetical protein
MNIMASFQASKYEDMHDRFIENAYKKNSKISNFEEFVNALDDYLGIASQGEGAKQFMTPDDYKFLFQTKTNKDLIAKNLEKEDYNEMFKRTDDSVVGDAQYEIEKKTRKGKTQLKILETPKQIQSRGYINFRGTSTHSYVRGYSRWQGSEITYLKSLKAKNVPTKQAIADFRARFKGSERSSQSISTKLYRQK